MLEIIGIICPYIEHFHSAGISFVYRYRLCTESDLEQAALFLRTHGHFRCRPPIWSRLPEIWSGWLKQDALVAVYWEDLSATSPAEQYLGYGLSVAISEAFAERLQREPMPYVGNALYANPFGAGSPVLDRQGIAACNAGDGLNLVMAHNPLRYTDVEHPVFRALIPHGMNAWYATHAGNYFKRIFWENYGQPMADVNRRGSFTDLADFSEHPDLADVPHAVRPILQIMERPPLIDDRFTSNALWMFQQRPALLRLTASQQRLLRYAVVGDTDQEVAQRLKLSTSTIKHTWRAVFHRFEQYLPALLPPANSDKESSRGASKRHIVLEYLRQNPHELRPFQTDRA